MTDLLQLVSSISDHLPPRRIMPRPILRSVPLDDPPPPAAPAAVRARVRAPMDSWAAFPMGVARAA